MKTKDSLIELFDCTAQHYAHAAAIPRIISQKLIERLEDIHHFQPKRILDLGCGTGFCVGQLAALYPTSEIVGIDVSHLLLEQAQGFSASKVSYVQGDIELLPLVERSFDLMTANLSLLWIKDLPKYFSYIKKWLKPDGLLLFTGLGLDAFKELSSPSSNYPFALSDMHTLGDALVTSRWQDIVMDVDRFLVKYKDIKAAYSELEQLGFHSLLEDKPPGNRLEEKDEKGEVYNLTWEVVYGQAWNVETSYQVSENGEVAIPISQLFETHRK